MEDISVKLYDVRRFPFQIPKDPMTSYSGIYKALLAKIGQVYSINKENSKLRLAWKDDEGEMIPIDSDDEVKEAVRQIKGGIFRVFIRSIDNADADSPRPNEDTKPKKGADRSPPPTAALDTHDAICDGCDKHGIQGARYKCLVCPDFDLCSVCEGKRIHDEHPMIRISKPNDYRWEPAFFAVQERQQQLPPKTNDPMPPTTQQSEKQAETPVVPVAQPMENVTSPPQQAAAVENMETGQNTPDGHRDSIILDSADVASQETKPMTLATAPPATQSGNPRLDAAVAYMLGMGYTNEDGWLTQLIEAKNCDIGAVLEILHPSEKP